MKYMTFNSSCAYAGVANMLAQYGIDTDDRAIAMGMGLPYLFAWEDGVYMAGPMLQSGDWFDLYLNPIGFEMTEQKIPAQQVPEYLRQQKTAMLGLPAEDGGKHAVVYIGDQDGKLLFLNNKWAHTDAPEQIAFTEAALTARLDSTAMIATLRPIPPRPVDLTDRLTGSIAVIEQNLAEIEALCAKEETVGQLRARLNTLFRPLLLDGITMLTLIGETGLAQRFAALQRSLLDVLRQDADALVRLGDRLCPDALRAAAEDYIRLIRQKNSN